VLVVVLVVLLEVRHVGGSAHEAGAYRLTYSHGERCITPPPTTYLQALPSLIHCLADGPTAEPHGHSPRGRSAEHAEPLQSEHSPITSAEGGWHV